MQGRNHPHLILSVDYEVFGNGLGSVKSCVLDPADQMMHICENHAAPLTFFVEALEFIVMEGIEETRSHERSVVEQLQGAVLRGHDAQLHLHPQFEEAKWEKGRWKTSSQWRIGDLECDACFKVIQAGKQWLEGKIQETTKEYRCLVFRAGGWCIQPSENVVQALLKLGFLVDSTIAPGFRNAARGEWSDFRSVPEKAFWHINGDVCLETPSGPWEVPIVTGRISPLRHLHALRANRFSGDGGLACGCVGSYLGPDGGRGRLRGQVEKLMRLGHVMLDFSTMASEVLIDVTRQWIDRYGDKSQALPLVAIAHTKNFTPASEQHLADYLAWAQDQGIQLST
ncbi:MAG TPA: hypothetical protein ENI68_08705, partial [Gammaproteobacteria bacterium]|nr:hypothetical protein [Gammaproteobacteria bacterium]